ncbi:MAG TPA: S8 family serine peptidase [Blastocatellia bacterium]|nr:S8 family serine peptidase [Blastocatellia bacterium]
MDGTSFAAPVVASVVAQMLEANPRVTCSLPQLMGLSAWLQFCYSRAQRRQPCRKSTGRQVTLATLTEPYATKTGRKPDRQRGEATDDHLARAVQRRTRGWRGRG